MYDTVFITNTEIEQRGSMAEIAVVHMDLMAKGGGEAVCMNVLEALQEQYDITLLTLTEPDFETLNDYFNTNVHDIAVELAGTAGPLLHRKYGIQYYILQNALLSRYARRQADRFDLLISSINELGLPGKSLEYVHFPFDWTVNLDSQLRERIFHPTVQENGVYERLCTSVAGISNDTVADSNLLANSEWTATAVEKAYGERPDVLYPPVDVSEFVDRPWERRERGFVTVGRVERSKRIDTLIEILDGVRKEGHDTHLHVLGPIIDDEYGREVANMATSRDYVTLEGEVSRETLVERICSHRYGIHGKRYEHFGMAVAELVAGGTITFFPDSGGQSEIVNERSELTYTSVSEAVENISRVLSTPALQSSLRTRAETIRQQYGRERFQARITSLVGASLGEHSQTEPAPTPQV